MVAGNLDPLAEELLAAVKQRDDQRAEVGERDLLQRPGCGQGKGELAARDRVGASSPSGP